MGKIVTGGCGCFFAPLFTLCFGAIFLLVAQGDLRDYVNSNGWGTAEGEVISSRVIVSTDSEGDDTYRPEVNYFYYVGDDRYTGNRLYFGNSISSSGGGAQDKVNEYSPGRAINVRYDPDNPGDSVVERRLSLPLIIFAVIGIGGLLATFIFTAIILAGGLGTGFALLRRGAAEG
jgi:hypothetical protein